MAELLNLDFMRYALVAAALVGVTAPLVGIFLVQRGLSLIGDGMGHVALAGVAVGVLTGQAPIATALVAALAAGVSIELIRMRARTSGDLALAIMFYGGIAAGVVVINKVEGSQTSTLTGYLFGAISTTSRGDLVVFATLSVTLIVVTTLLRQRFFAVAGDEEYARASGMPVLTLNLLLAALTAVTVVVSMRVVGLLLISALMIIPNAAGQQVARSFRTATWWAVTFGLISSVGGVVVSYYADTSSGGTIVLCAIAIFAVVALGRAAVRPWLARRHVMAEQHHHEHGPECGHPAVPHGDHVDYVHDGHRHAPHGGHYDEHAQAASSSGAPPQRRRQSDPTDEEALS
ncbi:MAG: metal ABC transporter permease [Ornithinimicrobium sp.]